MLNSLGDSMRQKRVLLIEDISCYGKCSTTVAFPILAVAGYEVSILPTAIFSAHTGISKDIAFLDFAGGMKGILSSWESMNVEYDAVLIGYAFGKKQLELLTMFLENKKPKPVILDPAMADNGKLYSKLPEDYPQVMKELISHCDYLTPNITEAFMLAEKPYRKGPYVRTEIMELLIILYGRYRKNVIITGIETVNNKLLVMAIDNNGDIYQYETEKISRNYSGTGDVYAALLLDGLLKGRGFQTSIKEAMELATKAVFLSASGDYEQLYFEGILKEL